MMIRLFVLSFLLLSSTAFAFQAVDLMNLIERNEIGTIEELIPLLPEEYRQNYTLMYQSASSQEASMKAPRAILYGKSGNMILTFNGDPSQIGYDKLEILEFNEEKKELELRFVQFPSARGSEKPTLSEVNPEACTRCHQIPVKPIWESYFNWPGAIGSFDDRLRYEEKEFLKEYDRTRAKFSPRYRSLSPLLPLYDKSIVSRSEVNLNLNRMLNRLNIKRISGMILADPSLRPYRYAFLGGILCQQGYLSAEAALEYFPSDKNTVEDFKSTILIENSFPIESFLPESFNRDRIDKGMSFEIEFQRELDRQQIDRAKMLELMELPSDFGDIHSRTRSSTLRQHLLEPEYIPMTAGLRYLLEPLGRTVENLSTSLRFITFQDGDYGFDSERNWKDLLDPVLDEELLKLIDDSEESFCSVLQEKSLSTLEAYHLSATASAPDPACSFVERAHSASPLSGAVYSAVDLSMKVLTELETEGSFSARKYLEKTCVACHRGGVGSPMIPFGDPSKLADWIKPYGIRPFLDRLSPRTSESRTPMPPRGPFLDPPQIDKIEAYLKSLLSEE